MRSRIEQAANRKMVVSVWIQTHEVEASFGARCGAGKMLVAEVDRCGNVRWPHGRPVVETYQGLPRSRGFRTIQAPNDAVRAAVVQLCQRLTRDVHGTRA